jgi:hypothetical protein
LVIEDLRNTNIPVYLDFWTEKIASEKCSGSEFCKKRILADPDPQH